jgi:hypothetical protein
MVKLAPALAVLLAACGGAPRAPDAPAATLPDRGVEFRLRIDAAAYLRCAAAAIALERTGWSGDHGTYRARGCGFEVTYLVACDAPDRCGYTAEE